MQHFQATIRVRDLEGKDALSARETLQNRLRSASIENWRVVEILPVNAPVRPTDPATMRWRTDGRIAGKLMMLGAAAWALWFFSLLFE
jgi:hypothetical protein